MEAQLEQLNSGFDIIDLQHSDLPVYCSIVVPNRQAFEQWPDFPEAATPLRGRVANGRGLSHEDCLISGLGEAVELASCCHWGSEKKIRDRTNSVSIAAVPVQDILGFSRSQFERRSQWNDSSHGFDWRPLKVPDEREIDWSEATDAISGKRVLVPAEAVFIGLRESGDESAVAIADSNGCAAGSDPNSAMVSALLELIERDATGRWWYGGKRANLMPLELLSDFTELYVALRDRQRRTALYNITSDLNVPCVAAVSSNESGREVAVGFSAAFDAVTASLSAVMEMAQIEITLHMADAINDPPDHLVYWRDNIHVGLPIFNNQGASESAKIKVARVNEHSIDGLVQACASAGCRVLYCDFSRPQFGVPVIKMLSPDLCHYKPRFGRSRLSANDSLHDDLPHLVI